MLPIAFIAINEKYVVVVIVVVVIVVIVVIVVVVIAIVIVVNEYESEDATIFNHYFNAFDSNLYLRNSDCRIRSNL
jgi:hypothetical protein